MTTTSHQHHSYRRLDLAGLLLLLVGLVSAVGAYWLIEARHLNPLILIPAVVAATNGASHLTKRVACRH
ncbi:hypothetical protein ACIRN4_16335 [Pimelobacter simplex]|uniref:hypothetical protein n=1 Tax=Nocardioides simplex TaxID=2045 RepID=UPI00382F84E5